MPVGELLARVSSRELSEWQIFEGEHGPLGPERGDWNAALVAHTFAAISAGKKGRRIKLTDFLLKWGAPRKERQTPEEQLELFKALAQRQETHGDNR